MTDTIKIEYPVNRVLFDDDKNIYKLKHLDSNKEYHIIKSENEIDLEDLYALLGYEILILTIGNKHRIGLGTQVWYERSAIIERLGRDRKAVLSYMKTDGIYYYLVSDISVEDLSFDSFDEYLKVRSYIKNI